MLSYLCMFEHVGVLFHLDGWLVLPTFSLLASSVSVPKAHSSTSLLSETRLHGKQEQKLEVANHVKNY